MSLCVLNNKPINDLEKLIYDNFSNILNNNVKKIDMSLPGAYDEKNTSLLIKSVPLKD